MHNLDMSNNRANMAYVGEKPWHGLGVELSADAGIDVWKREAGFDWEIQRAPVLYVQTDSDGNKTPRAMDGRDVLHRSDTGAPLSVVSERYETHQPGEIADFFDTVCRQHGLSMETMGMLAGGAKFWALAKINGDLTIAGDTHKAYLMLSTSCDGSLATSGQFQAVRTVCENTLNAALRNPEGKPVKVRHNTSFNPEKMIQALGFVDWDETLTTFQTTMESLAETPVDLVKAEDFFGDLLRPRTELQKEADRQAKANGEKVRAIKGLDQLMTSYTSAPGAAPGTAYGLVQGVTHYLDHVRGKDNESRLNSSWFGQGANLKQIALDRARELVAA